MWQGSRYHRKHHRGICQDKNLITTSTREASPRHLPRRTREAFTTAFAKTKTLPQAPAKPSPRHLPRQKPYHKHLRSLRHGIGHDKTLPQAPAEPSPRHLPRHEPDQQAPAEPSPRHLPRQKPCHKHPRSHHQGICQDKNLTTSTRGAFTTAFAKTTTVPQAPAKLSPRHLPRQKLCHKHPGSLHHGLCQDKNLTTSTRGAFTTI